MLGSGISRAARIPTGWEITLDLTRKLAQLYDEDCGPEPDRWCLSKFGKSAEYSVLLDALAKMPAERQQLLRSYWEPTEQEREEGAKQPTAAHRAIAALVAQGFVRVIITTNFDRLMETALADAGVVPTVLSSPDQVNGALPLIHTKCCVFKIHGDYLDTRIRNTPLELDDYPREFDRLLDRIFDEFGLIVLWLDLQRYPATLLLYGLGLGAVEGGKLQFLGRLLATPIDRENREDIPAVQLLPPFCLFEQGHTARILEGMDNRHAPLNDWLHSVLRLPTKRLIPNDDRYTLAFDKLEMLMSLGYGHWNAPGSVDTTLS